MFSKNGRRREREKTMGVRERERKGEREEKERKKEKEEKERKKEMRKRRKKEGSLKCEGDPIKGKSVERSHILFLPSFQLVSTFIQDSSHRSRFPHHHIQNF